MLVCIRWFACIKFKSSSQFCVMLYLVAGTRSFTSSSCPAARSSFSCHLSVRQGPPLQTPPQSRLHGIIAPAIGCDGGAPYACGFADKGHNTMHFLGVSVILHANDSQSQAGHDKTKKREVTRYCNGFTIT